MQKIIGIMDFAQGSKTQVMAVFTVVALIFNLVFKVELDPQNLASGFEEVLKQSDIIAGSLGIIYGLLMKVARKFQ